MGLPETPVPGLPAFSAEQFPEMLRERVQQVVALAG
jgi:hypothetical protein